MLQEKYRAWCKNNINGQSALEGNPANDLLLHTETVYTGKNNARNSSRAVTTHLLLTWVAGCLQSIGPVLGPAHNLSELLVHMVERPVL